MKVKRSTQMLIVTAFMALAAVFQSVGAARYMGRLPDDWVGTGLYIASAVGFAVAAAGFYISRVKEKRKEEQEQPNGRNK